ncbi:FAD-dependent 5-carboxymethylaminomethyl-2-thiouridine(34) oxidoreductase MnmC [Pseudemcibacter aquimaris]|uniref:FAD-dependent 5-carboxymethylaminomethyl-2-thiouridine(34) oxidoreductase MnmC n=1 Tax=Pseudemcibacter aquimaris TaxID=2857064 RepID=UPI002011FE06|nr:FAD-dependent 5-carboxymethylaminomethyl-2-thiouridine(34) oxidoreductase MnmC [Pseudemcibacter aquimaris]MCC3862128.1 FAD-dependent 5-carboxymethylaminomethyl-2-thiouridine(34) oxidoreductase MnmC [Pseudemcibacter aquimaris]WDU58881.1 FAD-dependent 5-carboxymethylaminomethyl-2-thiouridine(34) oxidoreductase MnmC [Pseudemcibacter aquimaris]
MATTNNKPWFKRPTPNNKSKSVAIIGGGIAGLCLAFKLNEAGFKVSIIEKRNNLLSAASGNPAAILEPYLTVGDSVHQEFYAAAYPYAIDFYNNAGDGIFHNCGLDRIAKNEQEQEKFIKFQKIYPENFLELTEQGIHFKNSGYLLPQKLLEYIPETIDIKCLTLANSIKRTRNKWVIKDEQDKQILKCDILIIANAHDALKFEETNHLPLDKVSGQITFTTPQEKIKKVISSEGYYIPNVETKYGAADIMGATFERKNVNEVTEEAHEENIEKSPSKRKETDVIGGRRSNRAMVHDHLPVVGAVPDQDFYNSEYKTLHHGPFHQKWKDAEYHDDLYIFAGLGARGFLSSPLLSEYLTKMITGDENNLSERVSNALHPGRFMIRKLSKK